MKFEFNWPSGFREKMFENVDGRTFGSGELKYASQVLAICLRVTPVHLAISETKIQHKCSSM